LNIGILSLQGDFDKHRKVIEKIGHQPVLVRRNQELDRCDKLIIPGGESTTFLNLIDRLDLREPLIAFSKSQAIMGTCAGLIILAKKAGRLPRQPLGLIDIDVDRNAYGRQINSFVDTVQLALNGTDMPFEAVFIRAPKIIECAPSVIPLATHGEDVVMARNKRILVASFHPEMTDDTRIHRYFADRVG
jgi:5'-phosphate synthase pdxT subunit